MRFCLLAFLWLSIPFSFALPAGAATPPATYGDWHSCQIGGGGYVMNVVPCPDHPGRLYAYVDVGGVYRSDDGGARWRMLNTALPAVPGVFMVRGLAVDPRHSLRFVISVGDAHSHHSGALYSTEDGGEHYTRLLESSFIGGSPDRAAGLTLVRDPHHPDTLLAGSVCDGVWKSTDNGKTWRQTGLTGINATDIRFDPAVTGRVWLCGLAGKRIFEGKERELAGGFHVSIDGGDTWQLLTTNSPCETVQMPADPAMLVGLCDGRPASSRDGGRTWQPLEDGLPPVTTNRGDWVHNRYQALAAGPDFLLCGRNNGDLFRLARGATAWQPVVREQVASRYEGRDWFKADAGDFGRAMGSIVIDPADPAHWFITDWFAIYQTRDSGRNWTLTIDGMEITVIHCFEQDPSDPQLVHLGMADNGYFRSTDGGETFELVGSRKGISNNIKCLALSAQNPRRLYAVGPREWHWEANQVFVSDNKGESWRRSPMRGLPDMGKHHCNSIIVSATDTQRLFLAVSGDLKDGGGVYGSTDGGLSWRRESDGLPASGPFYQHAIWHYGRELACDDAGTLAAWGAAADGAVYFRPAGSTTWKSAATKMPGSPRAVAAIPGTPGAFVFAAMEGGVVKTGDNGATWTTLLRKTAFHVAVDRVHPARLLASVNGEGVYFSTDRGATWKLLDARLPYRLLFSYVGFAGDRALVGTDGCGAFWIDLRSGTVQTP